MIRPFKTWITFVAVLTAAIQPTFAGGRGGGGRSVGGGGSRPAFHAPAKAPRSNTGHKPVQVQQPRTRNSVVHNGQVGGALRNSKPAITPQNGIQNGTISRGQTPGARRDLVGNGSPKLNVPGTTGRVPTAGGKTLSGQAPSRLDDIRRRINDGSLPGMSAGARAGADRHVNATSEHHEHHDDDSRSDDERERVPAEPAPVTRVPREPAPTPPPTRVSPTQPTPPPTRVSPTEPTPPPPRVTPAPPPQPPSTGQWNGGG